MNDWKTIRYPPPLQQGDTIGITAPSSGVNRKLHPRLDLCIQHLRDLGFNVVEGACLRHNAKHVSGPREARARDLLALWKSDEVKAILPPWGGELLIHLLPHIDFAELASSTPKWILGYSDISTMLFALTTLTGIATAHGTTLMEMVPGQIDGLSQRWGDVLATVPGGEVELRSSTAFQVKGAKWDQEPAASFNLTEKTFWRCMRQGNELDSLSLHGRIIGGCLETLSGLVGTRYGDLPAFRSRRQDEGLILYLENAESGPTNVCRMLWNMRLAGWFDGLAGILLGRSAGPDSETFCYADALHDVFGDLPIPIIYDADIGHRAPQMTIVNGAVAAVECAEGHGTVQMTLA